MNKTLIDNSANLKMVDTLKECISTQGMDTIRIATGYWDITGTALVVDELEKFLAIEGNKLKMLIGKDPYVYAKMLKEPKFQGKQYPQEFIRTSIDELADNLLDEHKQVINLLLKYCAEDNKKIEIRIFKTNENDESQFLHSKCYIFTSESKKQLAYGIIGSSNFTQKGLQGNAELNYIEDTAQIVRYGVEDELKGHVGWFEEKWEQAEDWTKEFLEQILQTSNPVKKIKEEQKPEPDIDVPLTPYELYIKLLQTKYANIVDKNFGQLIESYLPKRYDIYEYQIDAVKQCFATMKEHGGFMLADVVGLGKTIVGTLLIKHFLNFPDDDGRDARVLIITPPAIQSAWKKTITEFDADDENCHIADHVDYITTGSIGKLIDDIDDDDCDTGEFTTELKQENYGLIIIDESHKFRNSGTAMYEALDNLIREIGGNTGCYPYIGLLSATPQNNRPSDLQNQIYLFERNHNSSTLKKAKGGNLEGFFADINRRYAAVIHDKNEDTQYEVRNIELKKLSQEIRDCVLADIMVRRTRTDVIKYYAKDIKAQGFIFPSIQGPISLKYCMSKSLASLFYDTMNNIAPDASSSEGLRYYRYRAIQYLVNPEYKKKYNARGSRDADALAEQLARIMQINLVKRLESSFTAFKQSLMNLQQYTRNMIDMWEHDAIFICPDIDVNVELNRKAKEAKRGHKVSFDECAKDLRAKIEKLNNEGRNELKSNAEYHCSDFDANYIELLRDEYDIIQDLCERWSKNSEDPKFDVFKDNLRSVLFDPLKNVPQKLVVFTEAIDTAESIVKAAEAKGFRVLEITAANRDAMEQTIRENFDANYGNDPDRPEEICKNDYDIIVTTDVLAEGINLHRANCILNYDTPWNSTRLMQRIGRVNRIGSQQPCVYVYNFMPSAEGDHEIKLVQKAHTKLQSFHILFGEDSQIFSNQEEVVNYPISNIVNGEESPLEKYVYELKQYKDAHPVRYQQILETTEGLHLATANDGSCAYFLVRTPRMSGMFVRVSSDTGKGEVISAYDMYANFRTPEDAPSCNLPDEWDNYCAAAEKTVNQQLNKININMGKSKNATKAKEILRLMRQEQAMSEHSRTVLEDAFMLVNKGNNDVIKKVLRFEEIRSSQQLSFWAPTQEDFDAMIEREMSIVISSVQKRYGKAEAFIGLAK